MVELEPVIASLVKNEVEFVIIDGIAITHYGSSYVTQDFDFCFLRSPENIKRLVKAMSPFNPRLRNFPSELPFVLIPPLYKMERISLLTRILAI